MFQCMDIRSYDYVVSMLEILDKIDIYPDKISQPYPEMVEMAFDEPKMTIILDYHYNFYVTISTVTHFIEFDDEHIDQFINLLG